MTNPILAEVIRGGVVESVHRGAWAVIGPGGELLASSGDIGAPIFPRSAIKAFQACRRWRPGLPRRTACRTSEIALACASHNGEEEHVGSHARHSPRRICPKSL
jgi:L-asparaginase II